MPISRFYKPTTPQYTPQTVEDQYPFEEIMRVGQAKQQQADALRGMAAETQGRLQIKKDPRLSGSFRKARELENIYNQRLEESMNEFQETGDIRRATRNIQQLQKQWLWTVLLLNIH